MPNPLTRVHNSTADLVIRVIAGLPLLFFGFMHLVGAMPMEPIVRAADLPAPGLTAAVVPVMQVLAGVLLLLGALTRIGALLGLMTSIGGLVTNMLIANDQWPTPSAADPGVMVPGSEPAFLTPLAVLLIVLCISALFRGGGRHSVDARLNAYAKDLADNSPPPHPDH